MKKLLPFGFLFLLAALSFQTSQATHIMGAEITYTSLNACTVRVELKTYRDCSGSTAITNTINFTPVSGNCAPPVPISNWSPQVTTEVTPICASFQTKCSNASAAINGVQEYSWHRDYDFCNDTCCYNVAFTTCCRNGAITAGAANQSIYVYTQICHDDFPGNNSPQWLNPPSVYICNAPYSIMQNAIDPDGDSLVYSIGPCYTTSTGQTIPYNNGYSQSSPLGPDWQVSIDPTNGELTFTPNPGAIVVGVICIYIHEYRNGTLVGTYERDVQVTVIPCPNNNFPVVQSPSNVIGAIASQDTVFVCPGQSFCFDIAASDADPLHVVELTWDELISGATFSDASNPNVKDTIVNATPTGRFCWTAPGLGTWTVAINGRDNACPIYANTLKTITIISGSNPIPTATQSIVTCQSYNFDASVCGDTAGYFFVWSGTGGINTNPNNTKANFVHSFPGAGTYTYQVVIHDGGSWSDTLTGTVSVTMQNPNNIISNVGDTVYFCKPITLSALAGMSSYLWTTSASTPNITINTSGVYGVTTVDSNGCTYYDYVVALPGTNQTSSIIQQTGKLKTCKPMTVALQVPNNFANYTWSNGDTNATTYVSTAGVYSITAEDSTGCQVTDSVVIIVETFPDLFGVLKNSTGSALANQPVLLLTVDSQNAKLNVVDTAYSNGTGLFTFCYIPDEQFFLRAEIDSATYPNEMPTYAGDSLWWNKSSLFQQINLPLQQDIKTHPGGNPGGNAMVTGKVTDDSPQKNVISGLRLFLVDKNAGTVYDWTETDGSGKYSFMNVPSGTMMIIPDMPWITTKFDSVPTISISNIYPGFTPMQCELHSTWLEWINTGLTNRNKEIEQKIHAYPNPFSSEFIVEWQADQMIQSIVLCDLTGRTIHKASGFTNHSTKINANNLGLSPGMYFLNWKTNDKSGSIKLQLIP